MSHLARRLALALGLCALAAPTGRAASDTTPAASEDRVGSMIGFIFDPRHAWNVSEENFLRFRDMGGRVVRLPLRWSSVEPVPDQWFWGNLDDVVERADALGLEIIAILGNGPVAPSWATGFRTQDATPWLEDWMEYVAQVVGRYGDRIDVWEIGNEPFTAHGQMVPPHQYALFLRASYRVAKAVDPGCTVIHGGVRYQTDTWKVVNYILAPGAARYTDGLNFHTLYRSNTQPEDMQFGQALETWSALADAWGVRPDLYLTESAWASANGVGDPWGYVDEDLHAAYSVRTLIIGLAHERLKTVVNAWLMNDSHVWGYWDDTGFIREDGTAKAAWFATRFAHDVLAGLRPVDHGSRPGVERYVFRGPGRQVTVLWSTDPDARPTDWIGRSPTPRFFDQVGEELFPPRVGRGHRLALDRRPVYVVEEP